MRDVFLEGNFREFLLEDLGFGDVTTELLINKDVEANAKIFSREEAVIAGLEEASKFFEFLGCSAKPLKKDGEKVDPDTPILDVTGPCRSILKGERTILNLLMRMSGIATETHHVLSKSREVNPRIRVACTRKTAPGLRYFDKRAVILGGGDPHRFRLDDCILIKDNHLRIVGSVKKAVKTLKEAVSFTKKIEIEVETVDNAIKSAESGADIIMLDNMSPDKIQKVIKELEKRKLREKVLIEASGGITPKNIVSYANTGVDIISMGYLTHSVRSVNLSLEIIDYTVK